MKALPIKNEFGAGVLELARLATTEHITASRKISAKPVWLFCCVVTPSAVDGGAIVYLRNGETDAAEKLYDFRGQYSQLTHNGPFPIYFNRGLYIELSTGAQGVTVQYLQDSP